MRFSAIIFIAPLAFLMIQPLVNTQQTIDQMQGCSKMTCCKKNKNPHNSEKCGDNACNPFMACAFGNYFTNDSPVYSLPAYALRREKITIANDNRLFACLTDCWHPPESSLV
jgi:hypothetical protein